MSLPAHRDVQVWREDGASPDRVAEEVPVALHYNGLPHVVMMCTPSDLQDFARGFSVTEAIVESVHEIEAVVIRELGEPVSVIPTTKLPEGTGPPHVPATKPVEMPSAGLGEDTGSPSAFEIDIRIPPRRAARLAGRERTLQGRTGCGLCGAQSLDAAIRPVRRVSAGATVSLAAIRRALEGLKRQQPLNAATGATHAAAWATPDGLIVAAREDVGRHNALDKLIGHLLMVRTDLSRGFLVITSRASYEMVQKAAGVGMPIVVAMSAPTAYAVRLAEEAGITLLGFARSDRQVIYTCPSRIAGATV